MAIADIVLKSDAIFTGLTDKSFAGSIAIKGNKILAVYEGAGVNEVIGPNTKVYDYEDKLVMPAFIDAHVHYFLGAIAASDYMCTEITESKSEEECVRMVVEFAAAHPDEKRIIGIGWFPVNWNDASLPSCKSLDKAIPDKPVYLISADVHTFWLNTKALQEAGITGREILDSGEIGKFEDGTLNGLLFEPEAFQPAMEKVMDLPKQKMKDVQKSFIRYINSCGVTSVSEMSADVITENVKNTYRIVREMEEEGNLGLRLHIYPALGKVPNYDDALSLKKEFNTEKLKISGLKQFIDGVTSTHTGYLLHPYEDNPKVSGSPLQPKEVYENCTIQANKDGFGVRLHAIGDGAVQMALDLFEASNQANDNPGNHKKLRNSIEHCETVHPDDIHRFAELGVVASIQPYHLVQDANEKIVRMGLARSRSEWPIRSLLNANAKLAFGTDYPVVDFNPFPSIYAAVTRCDDDGHPTGSNPEEKISLSEALKSYTQGSAYVYGRENELGTLEAGKLADIVVIDRNLFHIPEIEIKDCKVVMTIADGKIVFERKI